jgi:hypothetical protein
MYFFFRSSWPQFSITTSTSPLPMPCQAISSFSGLYVTSQPSSLAATWPTTYADAS